MSKEIDGTEPRTLSVAFPLTVAAMEKGKEIREAISKGETVELEPVTVKGMFNGREAFFDEEAMKWGFIDSKGDVKVAPKYEKISNFGGGLAVVPEEP